MARWRGDDNSILVFEKSADFLSLVSNFSNSKNRETAPQGEMSLSHDPKWQIQGSKTWRGCAKPATWGTVSSARA